ncbi:hypothetical protein L541_1327 [Bordetella hinzii CA90 BAL1384]|nr:hypothetical protein L541_1327 [Bordetella hinzii CA90 BAL1384]
MPSTDISIRDEQGREVAPGELKDAAGVVYAVVERTVYLADKAFYRQKTSGAAPWPAATDSPACAPSSEEGSPP